MVAQAKFQKFKKSQVKQFKRNKAAVHQFNMQVNKFEQTLIQRKIAYGSKEYNTMLGQHFPGLTQFQHADLSAGIVQRNEPVQHQQETGNNNKSNLPDTLKTGVENLSGFSMNDVEVHYNSDKPAQMQAHAFTQGTNIHIAPGQEKHLPHEAWHVVQQKQGRVKPTVQLKDMVNINDDANLENEADEKGAEAEKSGINKGTTSVNQMIQQNSNEKQEQQSEHSGMKSGKSPVQRLVIQSPGYKLDDKEMSNGWTFKLAQKIYNGWQNLDEATEQIKKNVDKQIISGKTPKTKHWEAYVKKQNSANYGYLIEEGLNDYASSMGWALQVSLEGARPDYGRKLGGKYVMADLTTTRQSKGAGMHLAEKLNKSNFKGQEFVAAADITYDRDGLRSIPIIPARQECIARYDKVTKENDMDDYDPMNMFLRENLPKLPNLTETDPAVWQDWLDKYEIVKNTYDEQSSEMDEEY